MARATAKPASTAGAGPTLPHLPRWSQFRFQTDRLPSDTLTSALGNLTGVVLVVDHDGIPIILELDSPPVA
jgi:hypothetical protein